MKAMGRYCKAYLLGDLRAFSDWREAVANARPEAGAARQLDDRSILYLQEDYTVTDGVFPQEHVIFDAVTAQWIAFCHSVLSFSPDEAPRPRPNLHTSE